VPEDHVAALERDTALRFHSRADDAELPPLVAPVAFVLRKPGVRAGCRAHDVLARVVGGREGVDRLLERGAERPVEPRSRLAETDDQPLDDGVADSDGRHSFTR
jgi:hypothetical protein